eukprot:11169876-Lingulodinium_polyedra.AAC.1
MDWEYFVTHVETEGATTCSLALSGNSELLSALGPMLKSPSTNAGNLTREMISPTSLSRPTLSDDSPMPV